MATATIPKAAKRAPTSSRVMARIFDGPRARVSDDSVVSWLNSLGIPETFDQVHIRALIPLAQAGDSDARDELLMLHLRLIYTVACKFDGSGVELWDLVQMGSMGFLRAVEKYNPKAGTHLSTYAPWWVYQSISRGIEEQGRLIYLPSYVVQRRRVVRRTIAQLSHPDGSAPSMKEVALASGLPVDEVMFLLSLSQEPLSLDVQEPDSDVDPLGVRLQDREAPSIDDVCEQSFLAADVRRALEVLTRRERQVVMLRFGIGYDRNFTLHEVGKLLGISRERVRQVETAALSRLRSPAVMAQLRELLSSEGE